MRKKDTAAEKEAGWEFTLPGYIFNPLNWLLVILIVMAVILTFILATKIINQRSEIQTTTTKSQ